MSASQHFGSQVGIRSEDLRHSGHKLPLLHDLHEPAAGPGVTASLPHSRPNLDNLDSLTLCSEQTPSVVPTLVGSGGVGVSVLFNILLPGLLCTFTPLVEAPGTHQFLSLLEVLLSFSCFFIFPALALRF